MAQKNQAKKTIRLGKDIVASTAEKFNKNLYETIRNGVTDLTLDFVKVKSIDPVGLSVIAAVRNTMNDSGAKLVLKNVSNEINHLFGSLGLNRHFEIR